MLAICLAHRQTSDQSWLEAVVATLQAHRAVLAARRKSVADKCLHTPHNLYAVGTIETNFIESQEKKILPARKWNQHAEIASAVEKAPNFQSGVYHPRRFASTVCKVAPGYLIALLSDVTRHFAQVDW